MKNIKFNYLYRDGASFKSWGEVIFSNTDELSLNVIETKLTDAFLPDKLFIARQISIPEKFLFIDREITKFDHCFHEFDCVEVCQENPTDELNRSITGFLKVVELASQHGWEEFDILDSVKVVAKLKKYLQKSNMNEFDTLIKQTRKQAKEAGLKPADIKSAVGKSRNRK